jgi:hypothetical protein
MKNKECLITLVPALLLLAMAGTIPVNLASANPLPPVDPSISIDNPQNTTFTGSVLVLNFTGQSNWNIHSYYYSVDSQILKPVENITIILQEEANIGKNPNVTRTTVQGSCILQNLSKGWHNVTIYNVATKKFIWNFPQYQKGETMCQTEYSFRITEEPISPALITITIVATLSVVVLVYFKKRKH